ncbi:MAG: hypothetical protein ABEJ23_07850 [Haloarculaceae archaeon]
MTDAGSDPPRPSTLPPGYDDEDPYAGEDLDEYPEWWRENVELFRAHGMRPYRPPQFADGEVTTPVVDRLEADLGVRVQLRAVDPAYEDPWDVYVDGEPVASVERERNGDGRTVYAVTSAEFEALVRDAAAE